MDLSQLYVSSLIEKLSSRQRRALLTADPVTGDVLGGHSLRERTVAVLVEAELVTPPGHDVPARLTGEGFTARIMLQRAKALIVGALTHEEVEHVTDLYLAGRSETDISRALGLHPDDVAAALEFKQVRVPVAA